MLNTWNYIMSDDERILLMMNDSVTIYDQALYYMRQKYFETKQQEKIKTYSYKDLWNIVKGHDNITSSKLDINIKQLVVKLVISNWTSYIKACIEYKKHPEKFEAAPEIPKYMSHKKKEYNIILIDKTRFRSKDLINNTFRIPCSDVTISIPKLIPIDAVRQVSIQKYYNKTKVNIIFDDDYKDLTKGLTDNKLDPDSVMAIDIGVNNLCAVTINDKPFSYVIDGRPLKAINQFYNKIKAEILSILLICNHKKSSKKLNDLGMKRDLKITHYMHNVSKMIVDFALLHHVSRIFIGHNEKWKQNSNMGKKNNQNFVSIPFNMLIEQIKYKASRYGIEVIIVEESYTSKADHLAFESLEHHEEYMGSRIKRGLFRSSTGKILNSDINGAIGILRKGNAIGDGDLKSLSDRGDVVSPVRCHVHH